MYWLCGYLEEKLDLFDDFFCIDQNQTKITTVKCIEQNSPAKQQLNA